MAPSLGSSVAVALSYFLGCGTPLHSVWAAEVDAKWYAPSKNQINDLETVPTATGVYGFIFNSSQTPDNDYGVYNWCNMPHVRRTEYVRPSAEYELKYVELIHRHHKRTPYSSNAFPEESYHWNCDDSMLHYYGQPVSGLNADRIYQQGYISSVNPFVPPGWIGTCKFPQITAEGLVDSWQHGADLYAVYHDLLGFLPPRGSSSLPPSVKYRVTNNLITSQVVGMVINAMWHITEPVPILVQAQGIDSLEPQYQCKATSDLFSTIQSKSNPKWRQHLDLSADLFRTLDGISGVPPSDGGFHKSFDAYYDNLSARQCHAKPLPCKILNGRNNTDCVSQQLADAVYRWGNWEYSQIYRDNYSSLDASSGSFGVWIAELAANIRDVIADELSANYYVRVLFGGQIMRSSTPALGFMDMIPIEQLLSYFEGLIGRNASKIKAKCSGN
ncbi:hypothetical protein NHJ6243_009805 [Beauveria neobassiana]